jgi:hypothetical protein
VKLLIVFISYLILTADVNIAEVRQLYKEADLSEQNAVILLHKLEIITKSDDKVLVAYKGAVTSIIAKYEKGVKLKKSAFKNGVTLVEYAVSSDSENIEIRFVRLSVQQNSPKFLNYNKEIEEDKKYILNNFDQISSIELKSYIGDYILHSNNFTEEEKNVISQP